MMPLPLIGGEHRPYPKVPLHPSLTLDRVAEAVKRRLTTLDNPGFCKRCGADAEDCEPDARNYDCENCGEPQVFGADELLLEMM
jgi:predicted amidophosphoribosyltransferase